MGLPDEQDPDNKLPVMMSYGGPNDNAVGQNFEDFAVAMAERLVDNGNFHIICDHGDGHPRQRHDQSADSIPLQRRHHGSHRSRCHPIALAAK